jgi:hypothetical protein
MAIRYIVQVAVVRVGMMNPRLELSSCMTMGHFGSISDEHVDALSSTETSGVAVVRDAWERLMNPSPKLYM